MAFYISLNCKSSAHYMCHKTGHHSSSLGIESTAFLYKLHVFTKVMQIEYEYKSLSRGIYLPN